MAFILCSLLGASAPARVASSDLESCTSINCWKYPRLIHTQVDFEQEDGSHVRNIIADGAGGDEDLYMTYAFEFRFPHLQEGSPEAEEQLQKVKKVSALFHVDCRRLGC